MKLFFLITEVEVLNLYCNLQVDCFTRTVAGTESFVYSLEHLGALCSCWVQKHSYSLRFFFFFFENHISLPSFTPLSTAHAFVLKCGK